MAEITLRDVDNRDENGAPYEITAAAESVAEYIGGPLRSDLTEAALHELDLDAAIEHVLAGRLAEANAILNPMSVYLSAHPTDPHTEGDD